MGLFSWKKQRSKQNDEEIDQIGPLRRPPAKAPELPSQQDRQKLSARASQPVLPTPAIDHDDYRSRNNSSRATRPRLRYASLGGKFEARVPEHNHDPARAPALQQWHPKIPRRRVSPAPKQRDDPAPKQRVGPASQRRVNVAPEVKAPPFLKRRVDDVALNNSAPQRTVDPIPQQRVDPVPQQSVASVSEELNNIIERRTLERDKMAREKNKMALEKANMQCEMKRIASEKDSMARDKNELAVERDNMQDKLWRVTSERDKMACEKQDIASQRDNMAQEMSNLGRKLQEKDIEFHAEMETLKSELNNTNVQNLMQRVKRSDALRLEANSRMQEQALQIQKMEFQCKLLNNILHQSRLQLDKMESDCNVLNRQLEERDAEIEQKDTSLKELHTQLNNALTAVASGEGEVTRLLSERDSMIAEEARKIGELEQQVSDNAEIIQETRLTLNRTRNELSIETRKARQASEDLDTKTRQLEFVQQQCAILQENINTHRERSLGNSDTHAPGDALL